MAREPGRWLRSCRHLPAPGPLQGHSPAYGEDGGEAGKTWGGFLGQRGLGCLESDLTISLLCGWEGIWQPEELLDENSPRPVRDDLSLIRVIYFAVPQVRF